jgi:hypothetical protein
MMFVDPPIGDLQKIYNQYCKHKQFESVMPIFDSQFADIKNDTFGYYNSSGKLSAFSLVRRHDKVNAESLQFAWDYTEPKLRLGIESLKHECAIYKFWGFKFLYLGYADEYKSQLDGFELLSPYV